MQNMTAVGHTSSSYMCNTPFTVTLRTEQGGIFYESQWKFINIHLQAFSVDNETYSEGLFLLSTHAYYITILFPVLSQVFSEPKRHFTAQNSSCSHFHRPDMT